MHHDQYDSIIVGGGFAGIISAVLLARKGKKIALVEKNKDLGGLAQMICFDDIQYYLGAHHFGGIHKSGIIGRILKELDIDIEQYFLQTKNSSVFINGVNYSVPLDVEELGEYIKNKFPDEKRVDDFIRLLLIYRDSFMRNDEKGLLDMFLQTSKKNYKGFLEEYFENEDLMKLLTALGLGYGACGAGGSAFTILSLLVSFGLGACYIRGGNDVLLSELTRIIVENQGVILTSSRCGKLIVVENEVKGVVCCDLEKNTEYELLGRTVICTTYPIPIISDAIPNPRTYKKLTRLENGPSVIRLYASIKTDVDIPDSDMAYLGEFPIDSLEDNLYLDSRRSTLPVCMVCFPYKTDHYLNDGQKTAIFTFFTDCNKEVDRNLDKEYILSLIEKDLPEVHKSIVKSYLIYDTIFKTVTDTKTGSVFGWKRNAKAILDTNSFAPEVKGINGLYLSGNWSTDFGLYGAVRSSEKVCNIIEKGWRVYD